MIYAIVLELDSIGSHWVEIHGIRLRSDKGKPISFLRYLLLVLAGQSSRAIERIVDNKEEEKDNAENEQNTDE